ncbi:MAG: hypothetical protein QW445_04270 [Candidatus Bathyarchaeia archaeon]
MKDLEELFQTLKLKLDAMTKDAVRNRQFDFPVMNENWLRQFLKSNAKLEEKKRFLLTQIGYLRINLFTEYYERAKLLKEQNQLDEAVALMNQYAEIARIFIPTKKQPSLLKRLKKLFAARRIEPVEYLKKWETAYETWTKQKISQQTLDAKKQMEDFERMRMAFLELYTFSFAVENFPPLRYRRSDH